MRFPRIKAQGREFCHCVSRVVDPSIHFPDRRPRVPLGSQSFVESHFYNLKHKLGYQRRCPATRLTVLGSADTLWVFRDLRVRTIG